MFPGGLGPKGIMGEAREKIPGGAGGKGGIPGLCPGGKHDP